MTTELMRSFLSVSRPRQRIDLLSAAPSTSSLFFPSHRMLSSSPLSRLSSAKDQEPSTSDQPKSATPTRWEEDPDDLFSLARDDPSKPKTFRTQARDVTFSFIGRVGWLVALLVFCGGVWAVVGWNSPSALAKKARKRIDSFPELSARLNDCVMRASSTRSRSRYHVTQRTKHGVNFHHLDFALVDPMGLTVCDVAVVFKETPGLIPALPQLEIDFLTLVINDEEQHILVTNGQDNYGFRSTQVY